MVACPLVGVGFLPKNSMNKDVLNKGFDNPVVMANRYGFMDVTLTIMGISGALFFLFIYRFFLSSV